MLHVLRGEYAAATAIYDAVAERLAEGGATDGEAMAVVGSMVVGFARGDLSAAVPALTELYGRLQTSIADVLVLGLLDAGREQEARRIWRSENAVIRDYYWLAFSTMRGWAAVRLGDRTVAARSYADLLPFAGRIAGLGSGSAAFGPVDAALAALADLLDRPEAAAEHRAGAERVEARVREQLELLAAR